MEKTVRIVYKMEQHPCSTQYSVVKREKDIDTIIEPITKWKWEGKNIDVGCMINGKILSTAAGFEPTREFPNGFQVHRLNHSAKQPYCGSVIN